MVLFRVATNIAEKIPLVFPDIFSEILFNFPYFIFSLDRYGV